MAADPARLLALAEAISDGRPADWESVERALESDSDRELVRELRLLAGLADAHRTAAGEAETAIAPARWGVLEMRERLGSGTFGTVYRAWDPRLAREVALKLLPGEGAAPGHAVEEGRLLARVRHPHVITVFGADAIDGRVGIWMELIRGRTLAALLRDHGPFSAREAAAMGAELCAALAAVHRAGLVHRDVKAQNVMREAGGRLVLMDFGAGQEYASGSTARNVGTPIYMAPELFDGAPASPRSDIYSLGVLLFHIVSGEYPVPAATADAVREAHARGERRRLIDLRPDLPRAFVLAVDRALARDPAERFETAGAMEGALTRAFDPDARVPADDSPRAPSRLRQWMLAAGAIVLAIAAMTALGRPELPRRAWRAMFPVPVKTIVVVPLRNANDPAQDYFADGVTDILMNRLAMIESVRVIARTSIAALPIEQRDPGTLREKLGADYLVEGSVERRPDRIRIAARLVQASTGTLLWADTIERPLGDLFTLQGEIAVAIGSSVAGRLSGDVTRRLQARGTSSPEAQDAFLQGRHLIYGFDQSRASEARELLERAVSIDPSYGAAHASLERLYGLMMEYNLATAAELKPLAIAAAARAVASSPDLPEAHVADADAKFRYQIDWQGADAAYRRALDLAPHASLVVSPYSRFLSAMGRLDEALRLAEEGAAADPLSGEMVSSIAVAHYYRREFDDAIRFQQRALQVAPSYGPAWFGLARAYSGKGDHRLAIQFIQKAQAAVGDHAAYRAELARNYVLAGFPDLADQTLGGLLLEAGRNGPTSYEGIGYVYAARGDRDRAFEWLNRAMDHYFARMLFLKVDPRADPLRQDPRFTALVQRLGLQP